MDAWQKGWGTVALVVVWFLLAWLLAGNPGTNEFGDAMAPLGVAFAAYALLQAGRALEAQQEELRLTREEMRLQREASEAAAEAQQRSALVQGQLAVAQEAANKLMKRQLHQAKLSNEATNRRTALELARLDFETSLARADLEAAESAMRPRFITKAVDDARSRIAELGNA